MVQPPDVSAEDAPRQALVADQVFRLAAWAAEYAGYLNEAAKHLQETAIQSQERCLEALERREVQQFDGPGELEPEEGLLFREARAMGHASALLALLGMELALKAYQILDKGQHEHGHDLGRLFDSLNAETKARLSELGPEVAATLQEYPQGFVSLRYQFEELGKGTSVAVPRPDDALHEAVAMVVEALIGELRVQQESS